MRNVKISPSMMCADFLNLREALDIFVAKKIDYLHIDVMDGHYVPNFTLGPGFCEALAQDFAIPLDIHLMIEDVDRYIPQFAKFPQSIVCFHPEVSYHPLRTIQLIKSFSAQAGIAIDPAMPLENVKHLFPYINVVCVMSVNPGYAGQPLIPETLAKISECRRYFDTIGKNIAIEVDGNVSWTNIIPMVRAGADILVTGSSSIFSTEDDLSQNIDRLRGLIASLTESQVLD
jgi:ribulose-phosphate 3-epimerase